MDFVQYQTGQGIVNKARTATSLSRKARVHCWRSEGEGPSELHSPARVVSLDRSEVLLRAAR
jgi:hypothetical protein